MTNSEPTPDDEDLIARFAQQLEGTAGPEQMPLTPEIAAAFDRGYEHARLLPPGVQATTEAWLRSQDPRHRVIETTTPAEPEPGHWLKRLFLRR